MRGRAVAQVQVCKWHPGAINRITPFHADAVRLCGVLVEASVLYDVRSAVVQVERRHHRGARTKGVAKRVRVRIRPPSWHARARTCAVRRPFLETHGAEASVGGNGAGVARGGGNAAERDGMLEGPSVPGRGRRQAGRQAGRAFRDWNRNAPVAAAKCFLRG